MNTTTQRPKLRLNMLNKTEVETMAQMELYCFFVKFCIIPLNKISSEKGETRKILKKQEYSCLLHDAGYKRTLRLFLDKTSSFSRDDWYKKIRIVLPARIDYMLALVYS